MPREMKNSGIEWIGEIPSHWKITKCKYISKFINGFAFDSKDFVSEYQYPIIRIGDITNGSIDFKNCLGVNDNEGLDDYRIQENDILLAMSGATVGKVGLSTNKCNAYINQRVGIIRSNVFKYLFYNLQTSKFIEYILLQASGSAQPNVSGTVYGEFTIPFPPFPEQEALSDFLDTKCAEIDAVIEKTKATIEEYKALKQSIITEAVTKGIRGDRPMKDSFNIWYGDIPAEWDAQKLKYVFSIKKDIAGKEGYTVLSITQRGVIPKNTSSNEGQLAENYSNYQLVNVGDFAMNHMDLLTGWVDISKYEGVTSPDYRVFVLNDSVHNCKRYYLYLMQMCYFNKIFYGLGQGVSGMGRWRLQADKFLNFTIPMPPIQEQQEIADYLDLKCSEIDRLIGKKTQLLEEIETFKKSLIFDYVTGKKEVC